jgi:hypothetical protein
MRMIFINLPVSDLERSKRFYEALGFAINPQFCDESTAMVVVSETIHVMLLTRPRFESFVTGKVATPDEAGCSALYCLSAESKDAVLALKQTALAAGARPWKPDMDEFGGEMYGASFQDPDGHVWEVMWMSDAAVAGHGAPETQAQPVAA